MVTSIEKSRGGAEVDQVGVSKYFDLGGGKSYPSPKRPD
jgi:hypothetical protein